MEPYSGIVINAAQQAQANLLFTEDFLFPKLKQPRMLPIFNMFRGGNWSKEAIQENYGDLITALTLQPVIYYVPLGLGISGLAAFGIIFYYYKKRIAAEQQQKDNEIGDKSEILLTSE